MTDLEIRDIVRDELSNVLTNLKSHPILLDQLIKMLKENVQILADYEMGDSYHSARVNISIHLFGHQIAST